VRAVAGVDPVAGGTWLGVNASGVLAAVTNRPRSTVPERPRSRGLLVRDLLGCASARQAADLAARELDGGRYAGCNVLCVDADAAYVLHFGDWLRVRPLHPGLHVVTSRGDVDDAGDRRLGHALWWLGQRDYRTADDCLTALKEVCAQTGNGDPPICLRGETAGTVSSSLVALRRPLRRSTYLHAQGPPDRTPYQNYSALLAEIAGGSGR
jgi:hypothetical protein